VLAAELRFEQQGLQNLKMVFAQHDQSFAILALVFVGLLHLPVLQAQ
jgi:hypothetical protein